MHYLVAGGAGFIGSNLVDRLLKDSPDTKITVIDNFLTGCRENLEEAKNNYKSRLEIINLDICHVLELEFDNIDVIFNLACPASPVHYQKHAIDTTITSVIGTYNLLRLANMFDAKLLHASTSEIYGNPDIHPQPESYWGNVNCFGPRACYDEGKRCAETLCYEFIKQDLVDVKIVRIFNTYGPRMAIDDGRVVSNFIVQALKNQPITIYGSGNQTRSFCYVDDLIDGFLALLKSNVKTPMNLGNPGEFTMNELAEKILTITNSKSIIQHMPLPVDDPERRKPFIDFAKKELNWEPKIALDQGLEKTIEYFRKVLK